MAEPPLSVWGVNAEELRGVLQECFPGKECRVAESESTGSGWGSVRGSKAEPGPEDKDALIAFLREELGTMEFKVAASNASIHAFHSQQKQLFDEFCLLRQRYDDQKQNLIDVLWNRCATHHPDLQSIPTLDMELVANESEERLGPYGIGQVLGEGQFATVKACWPESEADLGTQQFAIKIIKKERLTTFASLKRVSNEIDILRVLKSPYVVALHTAIQAPNKLYIVTEKGGSDLFEFFDQHPEGVPEPWAKEITACMLSGILYCHRQGICHRDLKPENVLLRFDTVAEKCIDVKLCDFGLSVKTQSGTLLTDFCGSPGFFAPEMIIHGSYYGDKADVWSTGCILLELILGHERFCDAWMSAYDFDVLQDKLRFEDMIHTTVAALPDALEFPKDLKDFVLRFVKIRSSERPTIAELCSHAWVAELFPSLLTDGVGIADKEDCIVLLAPTVSVDSPSSVGDRKRCGTNQNGHNVDLMHIAKIAGSSFSERERKLYEEHNTHVLHVGTVGMDDGKSNQGSKHTDHHTLHLPPIEPQTPNVGKFRKILKKAEDTLPPDQRWDTIEEEHHTKGTAASHTHSSTNTIIGRQHDAYEGDDGGPGKLKLSPRQKILVSSSSDPRLS